MSGFRGLVFGATLMVLVAACGEAGEPDSQTAIDPTGTVATSLPPTTPTSGHDEETHDDGSGQHEESVDQSDSAEHDEAATHGSDRIVEVKMTEFAFEPGQIDVSAGETIVFVVTNEGLVDHEFRLSNTHRIEEHMASGHEDHDDDRPRQRPLHERRYLDSRPNRSSPA